MAIAIAFPGFNDLGRSVTHMFLLMDHCLYRFSMFSDKMEKIYRAKGWIFCQTHLEFRSLFTFRSSVRPFQMPLEGLSLGITFAIIYATDPLLQNMTKILFASFDSPSIFLTISPCRLCWITCADFQNQGSFPHALSLKRSRWPKFFFFFAFLTQVAHYLTAVKKFLKEIYRLENFCANVLKQIKKRIIHVNSQPR